MRPFPTTPDGEGASDAVFDGGHLWVQEWVDCAPFRFRLRDSGVIQFGGAERPFGDDPPLPYRHAVRHVRERFDREALRESVEDVEGVVFFGVATHRQSVDYDWARLPSFLGSDVWSGERDAHLPPDRVEQAFDALGLQPVNTVEKEVRGADFDPAAYDFPDSAWYDGPVAGVLIRNKTGDRVRLPNPAVGADGGASTATDTGEDQETPPGSAAAIADRYVTRARLERLASAVESLGRPVTPERLSERAVEDVLREVHRELLDGRTDVGAFRSAVARRVAEFLQAE